MLTVKKRTSLYDTNNVVIWNTTASVHIFRNFNLLSGTPVPVNDFYISPGGFNTNSGNFFWDRRESYSIRSKNSSITILSIVLETSYWRLT